MTPEISPLCRVPARLIWNIYPLFATLSICPESFLRSSLLPPTFHHRQTPAWLCLNFTMCSAAVNDTVVLGLISNNDETAYLGEVEKLTSWCQDNCLSLNVSKTKELIVDFRKRQQRPYTPLVISGTPVERVSSFKYLGVNISEDLTWTTHIQTQVNKARQRLYHLRQLRKFRVSPTILKTFYAGTIESVLTQCISVWYGNSSSQDCKALQRVVHLAERISGSALPSLQDIYLKRCRSRAVKITKDSNHPGNCLFTLLPSGKRFRCMMAKTERLRRSFFPQAIRLLNSNSAS